MWLRLFSLMGHLNISDAIENKCWKYSNKCFRCHAAHLQFFFLSMEIQFSRVRFINYTILTFRRTVQSIVNTKSLCWNIGVTTVMALFLIPLTGQESHSAQQKIFVAQQNVDFSGVSFCSLTLFECLRQHHDSVR